MKFGFISLIVLSINYATASDPYLDGTKRSKLFELTDFKVPKFNIIISDEDFIALRQSVNKNSNDTIGGIENDDPCAAVKATRQLLENLGIDINQMGSHSSIPNTKQLTSHSMLTSYIAPDSSNQNAPKIPEADASFIIDMLKGSNVDKDTINTFVKLMNKGKIDPSDAASFIQMMQNSNIDPASAASYMKNLDLDPEVVEVFMKMIQNSNKKEHKRDQTTGIMQMLQEYNVDSETAGDFMRLIEEGKIDPTGAATIMEIMKTGDIDPVSLGDYVKDFKIDPEIIEIFMKIMQNANEKEEELKSESPKELNDSINTIRKMLESFNVDDITIATFMRLMDEGKIDPTGTTGFMQMMQDGSIDPSSASEYMKELKLDPEVTEVFMKIIQSGHKKSESKNEKMDESENPNDPTTSLKQMLKSLNVDQETIDTFMKLMSEGKIEPAGATAFMKMMQSGSIDPSSSEAYMKNLNLDPEVNDVFTKIIRSGSKKENNSNDPAASIKKMLESLNVDQETINTFMKLMGEGKIDPAGTTTFMEMMQNGTIDLTSAEAYMKNNLEPEVADVFMKILKSGDKKEEEQKENDDPVDSIKKMLESFDLDTETVTTFMKLIGEGKIDPAGTTTFMKMMQSGSIDPSSAEAYMKNLNLEPEVADVFLKIMKSNIKPKVYEAKQTIYEVNAKLVFSLDDDHVKTFDKVKFGISGKSSLFNYKSGFKINIKEDKDLYGVKNLKLKADVIDGSMLSTKIVSDLRLKANVDVPAANYAELYINGQYMGLYVMIEGIKKHWATEKYGVEKVDNLYKCENGLLTYVDSYNGCKNEGENSDKKEWEKFLKTLDSATTEKDIEDIFDVDGFLRNAAFDYLNGSLDHYTTGSFHNFLMFKPSESAKWKYIPFDFDNDLYAYGYDNKNLVCQTTTNFNNYFDKKGKLNQLLIFSNPERFINLVNELTDTIWIPSLLYKRIDTLKEFLTPYIKKDRTLDENGHVAGYLNTNAHYINHENTFEEWSNYVEFGSSTAFGCGLKRWIVEKYNFVCENNVDCNETHQEFAQSIKYDTTFIDQVDPKNSIEKQKQQKGVGTGHGNAGIGDSQANLNMEEQYNIFKVCDSVDIFYVMANYYNWDYTKMIIDPETGLAIAPEEDAKENEISTEELRIKKFKDFNHHNY